MRVYHLNLRKEEIEEAKIAFLPGAPERVLKLGLALDPNGKIQAEKREFRTFLGHCTNKPFLITSTGIGGPSTSIVVEELAILGVRTFIRVGTCGGIQRHLRVGDIVITTAAVRLEGASTHYAPLSFPAVAHFDLVCLLRDAAKEAKIPYHIGITASTDTFYPGQERTDSFSRFVPRWIQGQTEELTRLNVLNYEMEAATLLTMCSALGLFGACFCSVVDNRFETEHISQEALDMAEERLVRLSRSFLPLFFSRYPEGVPL
ncbi:MAG: uridine phosphorylase [bacterium JZ-2024 1]